MRAIALLLLLAGCTPTGQQAIREAVNNKQHCDEADVIIIVQGYPDVN